MPFSQWHFWHVTYIYLHVTVIYNFNELNEWKKYSKHYYIIITLFLSKAIETVKSVFNNVI